MNRLCMGCMKEYDDRFEICPHCGYAFGTPPKQSYHIPPGSVLQQRYIVGVALGFGGFGITYIGWDYVMSRKVAIKEYLPSEFATRMPTQLQVTVYSGEREEQYQEGLIKTMEEAKRLAKFESVPGIVQIYDCFEENGTSYIIMEFLEGMSLKQYIAEKGKMTPEQALPVVLQIAAAMEEVHKTGILHRDIAPDNIYVLNPEEPDALQVKLLDFGAARYATTKHSKSLSVIIKPGYAPEEQYRSRGDQGSWTDVYALAATLYKMLTGITPEDAMERSVKDEVKRPSKMGIKLAKPTETALMNALNVKIQDRTQTMEEFSQELMAAEVKEREITKDKEAVKSIPKWFLALAGVGILGVAIAIGLMQSGLIKFQMNTGSSQLEKNMVRVPNVVNKDADVAETVLADEELGMSRDRMVYSIEIPENMVSYQEIKENTPVEKHTTVVVWISKGEEKGIIPAVKGMQREEAEQLLKEAGFAKIIIEESMEPGVYNSILSISEEQGANIGLSQEITITVCMNEENQEGDASQQVKVSDLSGMTLDEVKALLEDAGLQINVIEEYSDAPENTVIGQDTEADTEVNIGSYVTVRISKGPERIYMKSVKLETLDSARATIEGLGLKVGTITEQYDESTPAGKVISQSIEQDKEVKAGDTVDLVISKGKDPAKQQTQAPKQTEAQKQTKSAQEQAEAAAAAEAARQAEEEARRQSEAAAAEAQRRAEEEAAAAAQEQQQEDPNRNSAFDMLN